MADLFPAEQSDPGRRTATSAESKARLDPATVGELYAEFATPLRAFLMGLLRNRDLAEEVLQTTFAKAVASGSDVEPSAFRAWLFQVAYREAMGLRRRQGIETRVLSGLRFRSSGSSDPADAKLLQSEAIRRVQEALEGLPAEQRDVVCRRIYGGQTFAEIAAESRLPLGTVLSRMRLALSKLRKSLDELE
jgi:RNA polymerase sigma-70 factor (ECF subfamily)